MTVSPWAESSEGGAVPPHTAPTGPSGPPLPGSVSPPSPHMPPPRPRLWPIVAAFGVIVVAAVAITALVTAALVKPSAPTPQTIAAPPTAPVAPQFSAAEQESAKQNVCHAFDAGERGSAGQGGVVVNGDLNVPIVLRMVNAHAAVANALSPATPTDVSEAAHNYLTASTDLTTAALANTPIDKLIDLTKTSNGVMDSFADICGLPH